MSSQFAATASEEAEKINAQTDAGYVTDQDFWEKQGISTGEELALSILGQTYSDLHKELRGFRPRGAHSRLTTIDQLQAAIDDLDADSLDTVELVMALEEEFGIDIPDDASEKITTVQSAVDFIRSATG